MNKIHSTAIVGENVKIGDNVEIGAFCVLEGNIEIGDNTKLYNNVVIKAQKNSYIKIGKNNRFFPFCVIGGEPQDYKFKGEESNVEIGDNNIIREYVSINGGSDVGNVLAGTKNLTKICNNCYLYISSHVAHDVYLEDNVVLTNYAGIAGHCKIDHDTIIGGLTAIHQFVHIGCHVMIGMSCSISYDIPPYSIVIANKDKVSGANIIGLKRSNFSSNDILSIARFYKEYSNNNTTIKQFVGQHEQDDNKYIKEILTFIKSSGKRGLI